MLDSGSSMRTQRGFTLAELAIALVIVALLLASALIPLSAQIELKSVADTKKTMDQIQESLLGFAIANGRLPCPADGSIADGASTAGQEIASCINTTATNQSYGVLPWATLGVPATDAWGRRFSYRVAPVFADAVGTTFTTTAISDTPSGLASAAQGTTCTPSPTPTQSSLALCSVGNLSVYTRSDSARTSSSVATYTAALVISHGKNGYGARTSNGTIFSAPASGTDEYYNSTGGHPTAFGSTAQASFGFMSRNPSPAPPATVTCSETSSSSYPCEFDDIVAWIHPALLVSRMLTAGKLP